MTGLPRLIAFLNPKSAHGVLIELEGSDENREKLEKK